VVSFVSEDNLDGFLPLEPSPLGAPSILCFWNYWWVKDFSSGREAVASLLKFEDAKNCNPDQKMTWRFLSFAGFTHSSTLVTYNSKRSLKFQPWPFFQWTWSSKDVLSLRHKLDNSDQAVIN